MEKYLVSYYNQSNIICAKTEMHKIKHIVS